MPSLEPTSELEEDAFLKKVKAEFGEEDTRHWTIYLNVYHFVTQKQILEQAKSLNEQAEKLVFAYSTFREKVSPRIQDLQARVLLAGHEYALKNKISRADATLIMGRMQSHVLTHATPKILPWISKFSKLSNYGLA